MKRSLLIYAIAMIIGLALWIILTPFAKSHRRDPSLIGGECLMPVLTVGAVFTVDVIKKDREK